MMTSAESWSERTTQSTEPGTNSDLFRETIVAQNVYAAWARKLTNAKPNDPDLQTIPMEVSKSEQECRFSKEARGEKAGSGSSPPSTSPRKGRKAAKRTVDSDGFVPPTTCQESSLSPLVPPLSPTPPSTPAIDGALLEVPGEEEMETSSELPQSQKELPVVAKKPRIPPFFISPKGDWRQLVALAKLIAPSFQSQMSGRFLKVTVADDVDYRALSHWLEMSGVEFKSFMLKQDRPVKVVLRGLPSNTEPEDIKTEIEADGFKILKISQMKNYRTKAPMPLFYLQIQNGADAVKIYDFTELFGTCIEVKPFDRGNKVNQCWRCQGWFHSSEVCHLPPRCVRCAGPHSAKDCTLDFDAPMKCANCSGDHAAFWSRCHKHPNNSKKKNKNGPKPNNKNLKNNIKKQPTQAPRPDISKARKVSPGLDYSKVVQNKIPREHALLPPGLTFPAHVSTSLKIGFWNANSLRNKIHEVRDFVSEQNLDMFLVQETWLEPGIDPQIANYRLTKDDRIEIPHTVMRGGTAIYCKNEIVHYRVPLPNLQGMDATAVQIKINNFPPINIVSAYVRRRVGQNFPIEDFKKIFNSGSNCIIAGDYNAAHKKPLPTVDLTSNENIELAISEHNQNFSEAFVEASKPKFNNAPKILSPEIKYKIYQRNRLRKFWQRTRCPSIYSEFRTLSREIAKDIQAHSRAQWEKHIEALSPIDNTL
ncbi:nucleic-acid-binding protein from transposon X-element [Trichonephila clavipes]|nr:nucleic-acid-binding protein from transposon X-element [Trichonephila clavipes]